MKILWRNWLSLNKWYDSKPDNLRLGLVLALFIIPIFGFYACMEYKLISSCMLLVLWMGGLTLARCFYIMCRT